MTYYGYVTIPGGKMVFGRVEAEYRGSVRDWWSGGGEYNLDVGKIDLWWENGKKLSKEEEELEIKIPYNLVTLESKVKEFVVEQLLILGGEPYEAW